MGVSARKLNRGSIVGCVMLSLHRVARELCTERTFMNAAHLGPAAGTVHLALVQVLSQMTRSTAPSKGTKQRGISSANDECSSSAAPFPTVF